MLRRLLQDLDGIGKPVYKLELPDNLAGIHTGFHISHLRNCLRSSNEEVHIEAMNLQHPPKNLEHFVKNLDRAVKRNQNDDNFFSTKSCGATTLKEKQLERKMDFEAAPPPLHRPSNALISRMRFL